MLDDQWCTPESDDVGAKSYRFRVIEEDSFSYRHLCSEARKSATKIGLEMTLKKLVSIFSLYYA